MHPILKTYRMPLAACIFLAVALQGQAVQNAIPGTALVPAVWYESDRGVTTVDGVVGVWGDLSGNGNNASQANAANRPALVVAALPNGRPTLRFNGTDRLLFATGLLAQNWTCFAVARPNWDDNQKSLVCGGTASFQWRVKRNMDMDGGFQNIVKRSVVQLLTGSTLVPTNSYNLLCARYAERLPAADLTLRLNRAADGAGTVSASNFTNPTTEIAGGELFRGDIAALVVFTNALSDAEVESVERYLHSWFMFKTASMIVIR
jgi:hypothetical protein